MEDKKKIKKLSVVVLCYKSEEKIIDFIPKIEEVMQDSLLDYEIILVANYSDKINDSTPQIVKKLAKSNKRLKPVSLPKEGMMGWDAITGLRHASGDAIALIDGDGQMPPEDLSRLFKILLIGEFDFVKTYRIKRFDGKKRKFISNIFNSIFRILFPKSYFRDINSKPKIFTKQALNEMKLECNGWFLDGEIMLEVKRLNLSFAEIPTVFHEIEWRASFVNWKAVLEMFYSLLKYRLKYWFYKN